MPSPTNQNNFGWGGVGVVNSMVPTLLCVHARHVWRVFSCPVSPKPIQSETLSHAIHHAMNSMQSLPYHRYPNLPYIFLSDVYHGLWSPPHSVCMQTMWEVFVLAPCGHTNDLNHRCTQYVTYERNVAISCYSYASHHTFSGGGDRGGSMDYGPHPIEYACKPCQRYFPLPSLTI